MSDANAFQKVMSDWESRRKKEAENANLGLEVICRAAAGIGITKIVVDFDGCGDSGQIDSIVGLNAENKEVLLHTELPLLMPDGEGGYTEVAIKDAIETICYAWLEFYHGGWENNDGAYGDFTFDTEAGTVAYEHNNRFTDSELSSYSFGKDQPLPVVEED